MRSLRPTAAATAGSGASSTWVLLTIAAAAVALLGACSPTSTATGSPIASGSASAESGGPTPKPTSWPTLTVEAAIALGAANGDFEKMTDDIAAAIDSGDPARMVVAMDDAITFLTENEKNIPRLQAYDATKPLGDRLATVYAKMIDGARQVREGLTSGNADAVEQGFATFFEGNTEYAAITADLGRVAEQAIFMKRVLLR